MSNNARGDVESLQNARERLKSFERVVSSECDKLQQASISASSFCKDVQSRNALDKLNTAIEEIRIAIGVVQPVVERLRQMEDDIEAAVQSVK